MSRAAPTPARVGFAANAAKLLKAFSEKTVKIRVQCGVYLALVPRKPTNPEWVNVQSKFEDSISSKKADDEDEEDFVVENEEVEDAEKNDEEAVYESEEYYAEHMSRINSIVLDHIDKDRGDYTRIALIEPKDRQKDHSWPSDVVYPYLDYASCWITTEDVAPTLEDKKVHVRHKYNCVGYTLNDRTINEDSVNLTDVMKLYTDRGFETVAAGHASAIIDLWCNRRGNFAHATKKYDGPVLDNDNKPVLKDLWEGFTAPSNCFTHPRFSIVNENHYCYVGASLRAPVKGDTGFAKYTELINSEDNDTKIYVRASGEKNKRKK